MKLNNFITVLNSIVNIVLKLFICFLVYYVVFVERPAITVNSNLSGIISTELSGRVRTDLSGAIELEPNGVWDMSNSLGGSVTIR